MLRWRSRRAWPPYLAAASTSLTIACVIRKVDATGVISTVAGNGTCGYTGDSSPATAAEIYPTLAQGVTVEPDGSFLFSSYLDSVDSSGVGSGVVRKVAADGTISTVFGPTAHTLIGFTGSPGGTSYVVDAHPGQTTTITTLAPDGTSSVVYRGSPVLMTVAYLVPRELAVVQYSPTASETIDRLDLATGTLTSTGFTPGGEIRPALAAASDGTIYATDPEPSVVRITPDNTVTAVAGGGAGDPLKGGAGTGVHFQAIGLSLTPDDGLLISSSNPGRAVYRLQLPPHSS